LEYRYVGNSGLRVSPICLGTMTFGSSTDKKEAFMIMDRAYEAGINFFDTAELYPVPPESKLVGLTESIVGDWLSHKKRDSLILATKVAGAASGWYVPPVRHGLTSIDRFHIVKAIEGSLKRLKTDYIDLYQIHWPDSIVPKDESLRALDDLVKSGKVRYIGTSNDTSYGLTKSNEISRYQKLARFQSIQNNFSLLNPRFLDDLAEVCKKENISLLPYSPIAGGVLSGKYNSDTKQDGRFLRYLESSDKRIVKQAKRFINSKTLNATKQYMDLANEFGISCIGMAIAWTIKFDFVASTIIGATKSCQLDDSLGGLKIKLNRQLLDRIKKIQNDIMYPMG